MLTFKSGRDDILSAFGKSLQQESWITKLRGLRQAADALRGNAVT